MSAKKPSLLLLTRAFPPSNEIGSYRPYYMAKNLVKLGWKVTVLTVDPNLCRNVENMEDWDKTLDEEGIERILTGHSFRGLNEGFLKTSESPFSRLVDKGFRFTARQLGIDRAAGWYKPAVTAFIESGNKDVDVILATAPSFTSFSVAEALAKYLTKPYVLDYRDPWSGNVSSVKIDEQSGIGRKEKRLLDGAAAVLVIANAFKEHMDKNAGISEKSHVITNGFDSKSLENISPEKYDHFSIVYTGGFYPPKRSITPFLEALKKLDQRKERISEKIKFHYYGRQSGHVIEEAKKTGTDNFVVDHGPVGREEALSAVAGADLALVITTIYDAPTLGDRLIVTGKLFEPMGLDTKILLISPEENEASIILKDSSSGESFPSWEMDEISSFIYKQYKQKSELVENINRLKYSWPVLSEKLDKILRNLID